MTIRRLLAAATEALTARRSCWGACKRVSDKGSHWVAQLRDRLLPAVLFVERRRRIFEVVLGANNQKLTWHMTANGNPGASLRGWRAFLLKAIVFGADIDGEILREKPCQGPPGPSRRPK